MPRTIGPAAPAGAAPPLRTDPAVIAEEVASILARMTHEERVRAYRSRVFSPHELSVAAARLPEEMPRLNGDWEWLTFDLE